MESAGRDFLVSKLSSLVPAADFHVTPASLAEELLFSVVRLSNYYGRCHVNVRDEHFFHQFIILQ